MLDIDTASAVWETSLKAVWHGSPVWLHGDVSAGNLLVTKGRLRAVIDFGSSGVGDPACDLVIAWTLFSGESRETFRAALPLDRDTWSRGRGWALWKALMTLAARKGDHSLEAEKARQVVDAVLCRTPECLATGIHVTLAIGRNLQAILPPLFLIASAKSWDANRSLNEVRHGDENPDHQDMVSTSGKEEDTKANDELFVADGKARGLGDNHLIGPKDFKVFHAALCALISDIKITVG